MRTSRSSCVAMRAAIVALGLAIVPAVVVATGDDSDPATATRANRPAVTSRFGSADAAERWLQPTSAEHSSYRSADAAERWLRPTSPEHSSYRSADAAERWLSTDD